MAILMMYHLSAARGYGYSPHSGIGHDDAAADVCAIHPHTAESAQLYFWARPGLTDPKMVEITHTYLNFNGILVRYIFYFAVWIGWHTS